jgi:hypothetical protein
MITNSEREIKTDLRTNPSVNTKVTPEKNIKKKKLSLLNIMIIIFFVLEIIVVGAFLYHYFTVLRIN